MTDKGRFVDLLQEWEVPFTEERREYKGRVFDEITIRADSQWDKGLAAKVVGYYSFYTVFDFDIDGRFWQVGIWE